MQPEPSKPLDWRPLALSKEKFATLWERVREFPVAFDDVTHGDPDYFMGILHERNCLFFEVGNMDGLVMFSAAQPGMHAILNFVFYDRQLKGKELTLLEVIRHVFDMLQLRKLIAYVPADRQTIASALRRVGFKVEGHLREAMLKDNKPLDVLMLGLLRREVFDG